MTNCITFGGRLLLRIASCNDTHYMCFSDALLWFAAFYLITPITHLLPLNKGCFAAMDTLCLNYLAGFSPRQPATDDMQTVIFEPVSTAYSHQGNQTI